MSGPDKPKKVGSDGTVFRCPMCKAIVPGSGAEHFPFCSERCRLVDLNNWLEGNYTTSRPIDPTTDQLENMPRREPPPQDPPRDLRR